MDLSDLIAGGYTMEYEPQYGGQVTAIDGTDYTAKLRDVVHLTVPFIPLTLEQLTSVLQLFPASGAYVDWTYFDPYANADRTVQMKYDTRQSQLTVHYEDGTEYWSGLIVKLKER
jgi:hypothetical protein